MAKTTESSQSVSEVQDEIRGKVIEKLRCLVSLENNLCHAASKFPFFTPPGMKVMEVPSDLSQIGIIKKDMNKIDFDEDIQENSIDNVLLEKMTKGEKKAISNIKKEALENMTARVKSKDKYLKLRKKFEAILSKRIKDKLRPLSPMYAWHWVFHL